MKNVSFEEKLKKTNALRQRITKGDSDTKLALSISDLLVERAVKTVNNEIPEIVGWVLTCYKNPDEMLIQAYEILSELYCGRNPMKGKFAELGMTTIDHALLYCELDNKYHCIYIRGKAVTTWRESPMRDLGHAISDDLINWEIKEPVVPCPEDGWDSYQIWAPHIILENGTYYMFYSGVNKAEAQAIGIAVSKDLYSWEKLTVDAPAIVPGEWGNWKDNGKYSCRDACVIKGYDGFFYCYYCAMANAEFLSINHDGNPVKSKYCVGVSKSENLTDWEDAGFIELPGNDRTPPESPFMVLKDNKYYLFYTDYADGTCYAVSDNPLTGFIHPKNRQIIPLVSASEVLEKDGRWYISVISHLDNQCHFLEIYEMSWPKNDEGFILKPLANK